MTHRWPHHHRRCCWCPKLPSPRGQALHLGRRGARHQCDSQQPTGCQRAFASSISSVFCLDFYPALSFVQTLIVVLGCFSKLGLPRKGRNYSGLMHTVDWLPTLLEAAGIAPPQNIDGVSMWSSLKSGGPSPRTGLYCGVDQTFLHRGIRNDTWKLLVCVLITRAHVLLQACADDTTRPYIHCSVPCLQHSFLSNLD